MGCNCGKRRMAQMTSANLPPAAELADESQVEAMVAGAQSSERHNERVRLASGSRTTRQ